MQTGIAITGIETAGDNWYVSTEPAVYDVKPNEAIAAGYEIRNEYPNLHVSDIRFTGNWMRSKPSRSGIIYVLIYGGINTEDVNHLDLRQNLQSDNNKPTSCDVALALNNDGSIRVTNC